MTDNELKVLRGDEHHPVGVAQPVKVRDPNLHTVRDVEVDRVEYERKMEAKAILKK